MELITTSEVVYKSAVVNVISFVPGTVLKLFFKITFYLNNTENTCIDS